MKKVILLVLVGLLFVSPISSSAFELISPEKCTKLEKEISDYITSQNFCKKDEDCALTLVRCPFKCINYVNKDSLEEVNKRIEYF